MPDDLKVSTSRRMLIQIFTESHLCIVLEGKVLALDMEVQLDYRNDNKQTIMASRAEACDRVE
jgi:hypothetical protein